MNAAVGRGCEGQRGNTWEAWPMTCRYCGAQAKSASALMGHIYSSHYTEQDWICVCCGLRLSNSIQLRYHRFVHEEEEADSNVDTSYPHSQIPDDTLNIPQVPTEDGACPDNSCEQTLSPLKLRFSLKRKNTLREPCCTPDGIKRHTVGNGRELATNRNPRFCDRIEPVQLPLFPPNFYVCPKCQTVFDDVEQLMEHCNSGGHGEIGTWAECYICHHWFPSYPALEKHVWESHTNNGKMYRCQFCDLDFGTGSRALSQHAHRNHHRLFPKRCTQCGFTLASNDEKYVTRLRQHMTLHTGKFQFPYRFFIATPAEPTCGSQQLAACVRSTSAHPAPPKKAVTLNQYLPILNFSFWSGRRNRSTTKTKVPFATQRQMARTPFRSEVFLPKNSSPRSPPMFRDVSSSGVGVRCTRTTKTDTAELSGWSLPEDDDDDDDVHSTDAAILLSFFRGAGQLRWGRKHNPNHPSFDCAKCLRNFDRESELLLHRELVHSETVWLECFYCRMWFSPCSALQKHILESHTPQTGAAAKSKALTPCESCSLPFSPTVDQHWEHVKKEHYRSRDVAALPACVVCSAKFVQVVKLRLHMRQHNGFLAYKCAYCPYRSRDAFHRNSHQQTSHKAKRSWLRK